MVAMSEWADEQTMEVLDDPSRVRSALSPIRVRLLEELRTPASASSLAERLNTTRQRLGYHLRVLERERLIELAEERPRRGFTERLFVRTARAVVVNPQVFGSTGSSEPEVQDRFSSAYLVAVAARAIGDVSTLREGAKAAGKHLATATQEAEIRFESPAAMKRFVDEFAETLADLVSRYDCDQPDARGYRLFTGMHPRRVADDDGDGALEDGEDG